MVFSIIFYLASKFFENQHPSLSFIDLGFIFGEVEISYGDKMDINEYKNLVIEDENFVAKDENLVVENENLVMQYENLVMRYENFVMEDENLSLNVIGYFFTLISNVANVFKNTLTVFQKLFFQVGNCSFLNPEVFEEI